MKDPKLGDLVRCIWHDTLWVVYGYSETSDNKVKLRRYRSGEVYRKYGYPSHYELVCRPNSSKNAESEL